MTAAEAHALMADALRAEGATPGAGRFGHGLGLSLTEWPSFTPKDGTVLREGMVLALEPSAETAPGRILVHEENVVLRADGPELLSRRAPVDLPELAP
jgi:Xaa-Pro aminopeptidase